MRKRKKQQEKDSQQKKKYQFIQEQIRPQRKQQIMALLQRLVVVVIFACLFGGIAGEIILHMQKESTETAVTPRPTLLKSQETESTAEPEKEESDKKKSGMTIQKWNRISEQIADIGEEAGSFLVGVQQGSSSTQTEDSGVSGIDFGIIVQESEKEFYIITTCDIVTGQSWVKLLLKDDTWVKASVLGCDAGLNLAAVSVKKSRIGQEVLEEMTVAAIGSGNTLNLGTNVLAVGCPNGILDSVATGYITNNSMSGSITDGEVGLLSTDILYCETGNGVVLDLDANLVGFITTEFTSETGTTNLAFINISSISGVLEYLLDNESIPYIGCEGESINQTMAESYHVEEGAYITSVYTDSPAYKGGMRVADIITDIDGKKIEGMSDVYDILLLHKQGDALTFTVSRQSGQDTVTKTLKIVLG